ncbi:MAG: ABC transporter ATP-binding protein [Rhodospirillales bacterium]|jgi:putative spermidine/putrescine transport system ATP-binding protein|nr:ABC transporter ATP-binding protein [Rhodospirillales bacterium]
MFTDQSAYDVVVDGVSKRFGQTIAADNVTLGVRAGELLALLGPSGCGKTTTLRTVAGLVRPSSGEVLIKGEPVTRKPVHHRNVGMLFQNYALFPHLSVLRNVMFGLEMRRIGRAESNDLARDALRLVRLEDLADRMPAQLSGGQQQRVALARALVIKPAVLLLDEPFGAIDKKLREAMQIELRGLQERLNLTTILVTHDQEEAMTVANHIAVMREGRIEQYGAPSDIYERPVSRFVADFIGTSNFFTGTVDTFADGWLQIRTSDGTVLNAPRPDYDVAQGDMVTVAVRPEKIWLHHAMPQADNLNGVTAKVDQVVYKGSNTFYYMTFENGQPLVAQRQAGGGADVVDDLRHGDKVAASWEAASNYVVRDP